jgi:hypothetical protein
LATTIAFVPLQTQLGIVRGKGKQMKTSFLTLILVSGFVGTFAFCAEHSDKVASPAALVRELYTVHETKNDPFTQPRTILGKYFDKTLLSLYIKDTSGDGVGNLDFDPLYDAQDFNIKDLSVALMSQQKASAEVAASFKNMGKNEKIVFSLSAGEDGWRISDIKYSDGRTLKKILK